MKTSAARIEPEGSEPDKVLAVHVSPRVRGAIHRSLSPFPEFSVSLAQNVDEAKAIFCLEAPSVVLLRLSADTIAWAKALRRSTTVAVVFCYSYGDEMSLCVEARSAGMQHFVELPGDMPASWARQASRVSSTMQRAVEQQRSRVKVFGRSTMVLAAAPRDLALSRSEEVDSKPDTSASNDRLVRLRRSTLVRSVAAADLDRARRDD